jgi:hypothetical protein
MTLLEFVLAGAAYLDPQRDHAVMADVIARAVAREEQPLFRDDANREKTAALVLAVAWREGSLGLRVVGDCSKSKPGEPCKGTPRAFCTMQVHASAGGSAALNDDPELCIRTGIAMLRQSMHICPSYPVAFYASGPGACSDARAQRISRDRLALAVRVRAAALSPTGGVSAS